MLNFLDLTYACPIEDHVQSRYRKDGSSQVDNFSVNLTEGEDFIETFYLTSQIPIQGVMEKYKTYGTFVNILGR